MKAVPLKIIILGTGSFGRALAATVARAGHKVFLWGRNETNILEALDILSNRAKTPVERVPSGNLSQALDAVDGVVIAVNGQALRGFMNEQEILKRISLPFLLTMKSIEVETGLFPVEVLQEIGVRSPLSVLGGPHFSEEILDNKPTEGVLANTKDTDFWERALQHSQFLVTKILDINGLQVANALKNVVAIAGGLCAGEKLGVNAHALTVVEGFKALMAACEACDGHSHTALHSVLLADFMATTQNKSSRNFNFGEKLGKGIPVDEALQAIGTVEGFGNLKGLAKRLPSLPSFFGNLYKRVMPEDVLS
jgi:glycerol-3-phosphate dehydrogenase (NAD(P)+)